MLRNPRPRLLPVRRNSEDKEEHLAATCIFDWKMLSSLAVSHPLPNLPLPATEDRRFSRQAQDSSGASVPGERVWQQRNRRRRHSRHQLTLVSLFNILIFPSSVSLAACRVRSCGSGDRISLGDWNSGTRRGLLRVQGSSNGATHFLCLLRFAELASN